MTEFIGSRISLISKRDIRYVGTLHEISSENATVALEQVVSYGTEGRRPDDEVPPSDNVYDYIVFRGSDVKDLRIEEPPKENQPPPKPPVPDDPAILGSTRRPDSQTKQDASASKQSTSSLQNQPPQTQNGQPQNQQRQQQVPAYSQQQGPYPYPYPPPNPRFGPQGFVPGPGYPGMPYGGPQGWYPPPGYGFPQMPPGGFHSNQMPIGPPAQPQRQPMPEPPQTGPSPTEATAGGLPKTSAQPSTPLKPTATVKLPSASATPVPPQNAQTAPPPPPVESKPDVAAALPPPAPVEAAAAAAPAKSIPTAPRSGRIMPAVPLPGPISKVSPVTNGPLKAAAGNIVQSGPAQGKPQNAAGKPASSANKTLDDATREARAAVAAAMAKLNGAPGQKKPSEGTGAMENLTRKVNEMRTNDNIRTSRQPGTGGYAAGHRGGENGPRRGGRRHSEQQGQKIEVPTTDYDFASANAKFNKEDLVKEAIASGSPVVTPTDGINGASQLPTTNGDKTETNQAVPPAGVAYNRNASFFDNISSESKERTEEGGNRRGGREFRSEERQKNLETFGQGSVDNGYRGGYGRGGRGRGRGYRGRGGGRGGYESHGAHGIRGGRGAVATEG